MGRFLPGRCVMTRQVVVGILALLVLSLAACQAPPQTPLAAGTGQLLSERSQVFFQKRDQAAEEVVVNDTRAAGAGDEMWTQSRGRALLKFRDLWARLYDDTAFRAADVTPSSIKATLGSGAVLIGEPSQSPERVEIIAGDPAARPGRSRRHARDGRLHAGPAGRFGAHVRWQGRCLCVGVGSVRPVWRRWR